MTDKYQTLDLTGERFLPGFHGKNIEVEHLHRYLQACEVTKDKVVLDIASGEGYGSAMLARKALRVIGVDISSAAVKHARSRYHCFNLEYMVGSCADIPLPDSSVDAVVSFETIEHHQQHEEMMREIKRVLRPSGFLLLSSPDKYNYSVEPGYENEYHVKELYQHELHKLLSGYFDNINYFGQRIIYGSGIFAESVSSSTLSFWKENDAISSAPGMVRPTYWIALASDGQLPMLSSGVLEQPINDSEIIQSWIEVVADRERKMADFYTAVELRDGQIIRLDQVVAQRDGAIVTLNQAVTERDVEILSLNQAVTERDVEILSLNQAVTERDVEILSLNQAVTERDVEILRLNQAVIERDVQILSLNKAIAEYDRQIADLRCESDRIIIVREWELRNVQQQLNHIRQSRSWRVTAPLRKIVVAIRQGAQFARMPSLRSVAEYMRIRRDVILGSAAGKIRNSSLFDAEYYLANSPDVRNAGMDPAKHYLLHGWRERRDPSDAFSTSQYLSDNPDVAQAQVNPLLHYLRNGRQEGRTIGRKTRDLVATSSLTPPHSVHTLHTDTVEIDDQSLVLNHGNDEACNASIDAEVEAIRKSGLFDESFYLAMYTDLRAVAQDPIRHYCECGWREGRNPSDDFDTTFYLATYSDIRNAGLNPFWHYVVAGSSEMRHALPDSATRHENDIWFGAVDTDIKLLAFYSSPDWSIVRRGRPLFKGHSQHPLPHDDFGFYDPSDWRVLQHQTELARRHGFYGFCFNFGPGAAGDGSSQVVESFLCHDGIDFHFCVQVELPLEDMLAPLVASLARVVSDRRYICIADRPLILFTMPDEQQCASSVLYQLRCRLADEGVDSPFMMGRLAPTGEDRLGAPLTDLLDAVLDLPIAPVPGETGDFLPLDKNGVEVVPYGVVATEGVARARKVRSGTYPIYHAVSLGRDDTAQRPECPLVYTRFHVREYRRWLDAAIAGARITHPEDRRFVFVNAWNDWNGGLVLEPDRLGGFSRVNETTRALLGIDSSAAMPKVSVIVPNFNHGSFLSRRLESIYRQTYKNIEVILLDDCSSDQSRLLMNEYAASHPETTQTLYNQENSGSAFRQWAKGIKAATGDLVWIAESDDFCDERFLEVLVRCFDDEAVLLAYAKSSFVDKNEVPILDDFQSYLSDLECAEKWNAPYVETAHNEVRTALGIKNTIPNASGVLFKRPIDMSLLDDESWLSMRVAGDWVFYLEIIRGGKIAYSTETTNFFRRYEGSAAEVTYKNEVYYREVGKASRTVATLYNVPLAVLEQSRRTYRIVYENKVGGSHEEFALWYDYPSVLKARERRLPNVMVSTMGFFPGGAEILPIRLANEFKRQGLSVLLLNAGLNPREDGVRRMLRNDVPVVETSSVEDVKAIIHDFGVEVLNTHQWHIQKYPLQVPDVFDELRGHVASLHGMIEHGDAFGVTMNQLRKADQNVTNWVYTAEKNLVPFSRFGLYDPTSSRFVKMPNGMQPARVVPVSRVDMGIPEDAFVLCCVSRAIPDKGWAETILTVERARALSGRDIRVILVGNGPVYDEYCRSGAPDFVYLAGFSENSVGHYAAADMGIMLTKFKSESFPLTIVDCLFAGKPYIASDVGDIRNMLTVSDNESVAGDVIVLENWVVPIETAAQIVAEFSVNKKKYAAALALVPAVVHRYRIDVVASQYISLFETIRNEKKLGSSGACN